MVYISYVFSLRLFKVHSRDKQYKRKLKLRHSNRNFSKGFNKLFHPTVDSFRLREKQ